jgi:phosphoglycolate phosphatase-like HAD superfamily hydrolase
VDAHNFKIYLDLDGTILDVSQRHYAVHSLIMDKLNIKDGLSEGKYWELKRAKKHPFYYNRRVSKGLKKKYSDLWLRLIEQKKYLSYDKVRPYAKKALNQLSKNNILNLITIRQSKKNLLWQLRNHGLVKYFNRILVSNTINKVDAKVKLIKKDVYFNPRDSLIAGDSEVDIICGRECQIRTVALACGMRNRRLLKALSPDIIVKDIRAIKGLIKNWEDNGKEYKIK